MSKRFSPLRHLYWLSVPLLLGCCYAQAGDGRLYRWVDEAGNVHYGDFLPADSVEQGHAELDARGVERERVPPVPSEQERAAARSQAQARARDQRILATYRSVEDVRMARDGRLTGIDARIQVLRDGIRHQRDRLEGLADRLAGQDRDQLDVARALEAEVIEVEGQILDDYRRIVGLEHDKDAVRRQFAAVEARLRELRGLGEIPDQAPSAPPHRVTCRDLVGCGRDWERARAYLQARFGTPELHQSIDLLMARARDEREVRVLTLARLSGLEEGTVLYLDLQCKNRLTGADTCIDTAAKAAVRGFRAALR
ncbi:DUF4124 domain-containing protein [Marichromatium bheemlicum]|uniref:DUF4124 domain-containing protein n=1 Tax=Marichromatium bheemlicum TaxID=365339 RepID=A0ABX1I690_9GAMM|nr:DUF4124 domain-containing protein [Marichromatium bheemlicum]NKN32987.1 DUF4124 domain-containing protein [Marichromatium bheemlicum]